MKYFLLKSFPQRWQDFLITPSFSDWRPTRQWDFWQRGCACSMLFEMCTIFLFKKKLDSMFWRSYWPVEAGVCCTDRSTGEPLVRAGGSWRSSRGAGWCRGGRGWSPADCWPSGRSTLWRCEGPSCRLDRSVTWSSTPSRECARYCSREWATWWWASGRPGTPVGTTCSGTASEGSQSSYGSCVKHLIKVIHH